MRRVEYVLPALLLFCVLGLVSYATYFSPSGPWYLAVAVEEANKEALLFRYADAVASTSSTSHTATVYISNPSHVALLRQAGITLLDPLGVPLCLKP